MAIAVPLHVVATHGDGATARNVLAAGTVAVAAGPLHYAAYTAGGVLGSSLTGALADGARFAGFSTLADIRAASVVAAAAAAAATATFAVTGGPPWGAVLDSGGATYVTQGGNVPRSVRRDDGVGGRVHHLPGGRARRDIGLGEHATL